MSPPGPRRLWLLLPAYEEEHNLGPLLTDVAMAVAAWPGGAPTFRALVVDDGSLDGTAQVARRGAQDLDVALIQHERNLGLGAAMRTGIEHVLAHAGPNDILLAMDADHTHPPELMPALVACLDRGADMAICSRFLPGAEVHGLDGLRVVISHTASWLLRVLFPGARDYTCGYRAYSVPLLRWGHAHYGRHFLNQRGFSVMVDLLLKLRRRARRIDEVPLVLRYDRKRGASKMKLARTTIDTLRLLARRFVGDPSGPERLARPADRSP